MTENEKTPNIVSLENRSNLSVSGVNDVDSFNDKEIVAYTDYGQLNIQGDELNIKRLSVESGELIVEGAVTALIYTQNRPREGLIKKLFR